MNGEQPVKTILILAANPKGSIPLRLDEEVREIEAGLQRSRGRDQFVVKCQVAVRPRDVRSAMLNHKPQVVHFCGQGKGEQGLVLEDETGKPKLVSTRALASLFKLFADQVECVLLNACYSEKQAVAIAQYIPYVIGMNNDIGARATTQFASGFYEAIGYGRSVAEAFEFGQVAIDMDGLPESAIPVLKMHEAKPDTQPEEQAAQPDLSPPLTSSLSWEEPEGLVPIGSPFYIERLPIEPDCYAAVIKPYSLIRIKAPRQMGKTSLLVRILHHAELDGYATVRLNLQTVESQLLNDLNGFLQWLCSSVTEELDLPDAVAEYWTETRGIVRRCQRYFERYLLEKLDKPLVLGLDEVDQVFEHPEIATDFFGMLRDWHEAGKTTSIWRKLHLVIVHSKEVYIPLSINRSPFNVGTSVELRTLNLSEIEALIDRHELNLSKSQQQQLIDLVGGHPYLLRVALCQLVRGRSTLSSLLTEAPTEGGLFNDHLRRHRWNLEADENLYVAFQQVISSNQPVQIGSTEAFKLSSMGLVKYQGNEVLPLCNLYRQYFKQRLGRRSQR